MRNSFRPLPIFTLRVWVRNTRCGRDGLLFYLAHNVSNVAADSAPFSRGNPIKATFEAAGVRSNVVDSLKAAFPQIQHPTEMQTRLIKATVSGQDVLLKDRTGTGK
jgi:hypothetical protein